MVSSSASDCFFVANSVSKVIVDKKEYSPLNKMERAITGEQIKKVCIPLTIDRLGNIKLKK
jgi:CRISPR-associated endonuclease Csn1